MSPFNPIKGFEAAPSESADQKREREERELKEKFNDVMGGKFHLVPDVTFDSKLNGVDAVSVLVPELKPDQTAPGSLNVEVFYTEGGKERHNHFFLTDKGLLGGRISPDLAKRGLSHDDILKDVIRDFETSRLLTGELPWVNYAGDILPSGEGFEPTGRGGKGGSERPRLDPERLKFLSEQPDVRFGFRNNRKGGLNGYHGFVYEHFAILEHPKTRNAAFFIDFPEPVDARSLPKTEKEIEAWLAQQAWTKDLSRGRVDLRKSGFTYVVHQGDWKAEMTAEMERRRAGTKKSP